jgi:hypothetical protein
MFENEIDSRGPLADISVGVAIFTFIVAISVNSHYAPHMVVPIIAGGIAGSIFGLISGRVARKHGSRLIGEVALALCMVAGGIGGLLLAIPTAAILIGIAMRGRPAAASHRRQTPSRQAAHVTARNLSTVLATKPGLSAGPGQKALTGFHSVRRG